jgi:hypothetical protein
MSARMPEGSEGGELTGLDVQEKDADCKKRSQVIPGLFNVQKYETKAGEDEEQAEFEILTAVQEPVPCPQSLRNGHGKEFDRDDEQENAAETHGGSRNVEQGADAGTRGNGEMDHARLDCLIPEGDH